MNILIVLLGCHLSYLLNDRINTATQFAEYKSKYNSNIVWFLSGGIKDTTISTRTEAEIMASSIQLKSFPYFSHDWNYIYDTIATNTAENFIMVQQYLNETIIIYDEVYIVTSDFHYERANLIASNIIVKIPINWILSNAELDDSRYWEKIHIQNVEADVQRAKNKYSY